MLALPGIDNVEELLPLERFGPIANRGQVGRRVGKGAVALSDNEGCRVLFDEDAERPFAFLRNAALFE